MGRGDRAVLWIPVAQNVEDVICVLARLARLLVRRRRMAEIGLCSAGSPCAWHARALDRAIVSYVSLAQELGLGHEARAILDAYGLRDVERSRAA